MTPQILADIARKPLALTPSYSDVSARYEGTRIPLTGSVTITSTQGRLDAALLHRGDWIAQMLSGLPPGTAVPFGGFFRAVTPGTLIGESGRGRILPDDGEWEARLAIFYGERSRFTQDEGYWTTYRFRVGELRVHGPAFGRDIAVTRYVFAGGEWNVDSSFAGRALLVRAHTTESTRIEDEMLSATIGGVLDEVEAEALWLLLSFVSGNRLHALVEEDYDETGQLIQARHQRGGGISIGRDAPFHPMHAPTTGDGIATIAEGILRLLRADFPIDIVFDHFHTANSGNIDIDAQHFILAIHSAFEAWNRVFGLEYWIDDECWEWFVMKVRRPLLSPIYDTIGPEVKANVASAIRHSNRTTTAWRERQFFEALQIDVTDRDNARALSARDEILHNGHFLRRWRELSPEERQERRDDVERLHRLVLLTIFRLTLYEGQFMDPIRLVAEHVSPVPLPDVVMPPIRDAPGGSTP